MNNDNTPKRSHARPACPMPELSPDAPEIKNIAEVLLGTLPKKRNERKYLREWESEQCPKVVYELKEGGVSQRR